MGDLKHPAAKGKERFPTGLRSIYVLCMLLDSLCSARHARANPPENTGKGVILVIFRGAAA